MPNLVHLNSVPWLQYPLSLSFGFFHSSAELQITSTHACFNGFLSYFRSHPNIFFFFSVSISNVCSHITIAKYHFCCRFFCVYSCTYLQLLFVSINEDVIQWILFIFRCYFQSMIQITYGIYWNRVEYCDVFTVYSFRILYILQFTIHMCSGAFVSL